MVDLLNSICLISSRFLCACTAVESGGPWFLLALFTAILVWEEVRGMQSALAFVVGVKGGFVSQEHSTMPCHVHLDRTVVLRSY